MSLIMPSNYPLPQGHPLSIRHRHTHNPHLSTIGSNAATAGPAQPQSPAPSQLPTTSAADAVLQMVNSSTHLHSRPSEFVLGNGTMRGHLELLLTFDANVHSRRDVEEYIQDCYEAAMYYFGGEDAAPAQGKL